MKFKLLAEKHTEGAIRDENGVVTTPEVNYRKGDIVESDRDLCEIWNKGGEVRFERLDADDKPVEPEEEKPAE